VITDELGDIITTESGGGLLGEQSPID